MTSVPVAIIGAGPSGLATAIQLKRFGTDPLVLEREASGGLLRNANLVENYPGFPRGIKGVDLVRLFTDQARSLGVLVNHETAKFVERIEGEYQIITDQGKYRSPYLVIASGTKPKHFVDVEIPDELSGRIHYEVYPLLNMKEKEIAIIGAGDAAFDYALNLAEHNQVSILNRGDKVRCLPLLRVRAQLNEHIEYLDNTSMDAIQLGSRGRLLIKCSSPAGKMELIVDYLVGAMGREPQLDFVSEAIRGNIDSLVGGGSLYLAGDVKNGRYRQTGIAVGDGLLTAMQIHEKIVRSVG